MVSPQKQFYEAKSTTFWYQERSCKAVSFASICFLSVLWVPTMSIVWNFKRLCIIRNHGNTLFAVAKLSIVEHPTHSPHRSQYEMVSIKLAWTIFVYASKTLVVYLIMKHLMYQTIVSVGAFPHESSLQKVFLLFPSKTQWHTVFSL